ncbi:MAG: branched-chain amino acid ABC transporter permease [Dehalococcoidia bacterium]|nr:branched-chain amino acid ABC transporter permease [Dehalococcoidia bacterium]
MQVFFLASASFWFDQTVNGLTSGSIYALLALGYTMVYGVLQLINFAHGEVFMLGSFAGYFVMVGFGGDEIAGPMIAVSILCAIIVAMAASSAAAVAIERIAYRPVRNAPRLTALISAIGVSIFLQFLVLDMTSAKAKFYPAIFPEGSVGVSDYQVSYIQLFLIGASIVMMLFLYVVVQRTSTGRAIRAVAEDKDNAALLGVNVNRTIVIVFILGAAMAAVGGVLWGLFFRGVRGTMGFLPGIKAFTAAVLGGIGSIPGAVAGGYFLGLAETVGREMLTRLPGVEFGNEWRDVIAFSLLVLVLLFRPTGIFGERTYRRA